ncbi:MAG: hypothetical protein IPO22_04215, partial [Anaerolineales bacterium]|nr:hypothetical protein [Anaerolineales bacterium]
IRTMPTRKREQHDLKFGMTREESWKRRGIAEKHGLPLNGIHFHQGSNFRDASPLVAAI